ncbi:DUF6882 domain-containing protein [Salipiger sp.]|uniref:DUF6882 domain-containing protein n=1 Tax=Salipiger sp. TaxID=2078585 RepID=UPI003A974E8F
MFRFDTTTLGLAAQRDAALWGGYAGQGLWVIDPATGEPQPACDPGFARMLDLVAEEARDSMPPLVAEFGLDDPRLDWTLLPRRGLLRATTPEGATWFARYSQISTWNEDGHGWLWSWAEPAAPDLPDTLRIAAHRLRLDGRNHGWRAATERCLLVDAATAWRLALLAAQASDYPLVFRAPAGGGSYRLLALDFPVRTN